jgi:CRISPR-associated protein Cst1
MAEVSAVITAASPVRLTGHPLQRCGARVAAELAGVQDPADITTDGLDEVAGMLTVDIVRAAVVPDTAGAYGWWKVLFALYPNSYATHGKRKKVPAELTPVVASLFAADPVAVDPVAMAVPGQALRPCAFCGQAAGTLWGKANLPMFDSPKSVNTLPPGLAGWPVCRGCRIAMWAFPYGAWVTEGSATVLACASDEVERRFVHRNIRRARKIQHAGFSSLPALASAETVTLAALREYAATAGPAAGPVPGPAPGATLWMFKNDNQEPWLRTTATRGGIPAFVRQMLADPQPSRGWGALQRVLTQKDKNGLVTASGSAAAAKTLFDLADLPGGPPPDRLQRELLRLTRSPEKFAGPTLTVWRALCRLHLEVVHGMDTRQLKPARELIVDWIMAETNPRGRFNDYVTAASRPAGLQKLLMKANARLILDTGTAPDVSGVTQLLFAPDISAWRLRGQLYFEVLAELVARGAPIARKPEPDGDGEPDESAEEADLESAFNPPVTYDETDESGEWG